MEGLLVLLALLAVSALIGVLVSRVRGLTREVDLLKSYVQVAVAKANDGQVPDLPGSAPDAQDLQAAISALKTLGVTDGLD